MAFDPLAVFAPMLGLTKEQTNGLRDPRFHAALLKVWAGLQAVSPERIERLEIRLDAIEDRLDRLEIRLDAIEDRLDTILAVLAGTGRDPGRRTLAGPSDPASGFDPDHGNAEHGRTDRAA